MHESDDPVRPAGRRRRHAWARGLLTTGGVVLFIAAVLAYFEWRGWPILRRPLENWATQHLDRTVTFDGSGSRWRLHLLGCVRLDAERLEIGPPSWSTLGPTLVASDAKLRLRYRDLFAVRKGEPLNVESLEAGTVALRLQRLPDGRASWQFGSGSKPGAAPSKFNGVHFELLIVNRGMAVVDDRLNTLSMVANFALRDGTSVGKGKDSAGIQAEADGSYRKLPLTASLRSGSALPWLSSDPAAPAVPVSLRVQAGEARLAFDGQVRDLLASQGLTGSYELSGPSLAAVGQALGLTLPTTPAFAMQGSVTRDGTRWTTAVKQATVGRSRMMGDFAYDRPPGITPKLSGTLNAPIVWLADLGPVIGASPDKQARPAHAPGRVLPDRPFDLPSLRKMDADVQIHVTELQSGSERLQAVKPLRLHLALQDGVLLLDQVDARLAQGQITGSVRLDGRQPVAQWDTELGLKGLQLEQWLLNQRKGGGAPYVTGRIGGHLSLKGQGRSTAQMLATSNGRLSLYWTQGTISHLLVEEAGIDFAQLLGVWIKGDDALPVSCAVADLQVRQGQATPRLFVIDTADSTLLLDGSVSLATERLDLVMHVSPKDKTPLALRTPILIGGTFGAPSASLDKGPMARRLVPAAILAAVNPFAALLPLIDLGDPANRAAMQKCQLALQERAM